VTPTLFRRYSWVVLAFTLLVIAWGAYVRASGSGAGCGNHWPSCDGEMLPRPKTIQMLVELTHRMTSAAITVLVVLALVLARMIFPRGHPVRRTAALSVLFLVLEALVGAALVRLELVAHNASPERGAWMAAHLLNTMFLLASLALTAHFARPAPPLLMFSRASVVRFSFALGGMLLIGVTGAIAALGDTLFPATSLAAGLAQDGAVATHVFLRIRVLHPVLAIVVGAYVVGLASMRSASRRIGFLVKVAVLGQLALGTLNLILLAPIGLQLVHLVLADTAWIALCLLVVATGESVRAPT
jgi:heme A synthase